MTTTGLAYAGPADRTHAEPRAPMSEYEVVSYEVKPVEGDEQVELVIHATDGSRWEYGIPYSVTSGRYTFEEVDVLAMDFGDEFAEEVTAKLDELVASLTKS